MERRWRETDSDWIRDDLAKYQSNKACDVCNGHRLKPEALAVKLDGLHISQVAEFSVAHAAAWFSALNGKLRPKQQEIAARILKAINERLRFLVDVGLDYLTLSRGSGSLSRSEEHTSELQSLMRLSYAVFCLKKTKNTKI